MWKGYSAQTALISMLEKWEISLNKRGCTGTILIDSVNSFGTKNHGILSLN